MKKAKSPAESVCQKGLKQGAADVAEGLFTHGVVLRKRAREYVKKSR